MTSKGEVFINMCIDVEHGRRETAPVVPFSVLPIEGEPGFEALEYFLPFDQIFGTNRTQYDPEQVAQNQSVGLVKRLNLDQPRSSQRDTWMALLLASGINVNLTSAYRSEGALYQERVMTFQLLFPITGGGVIRMAESLFDIKNPTFQPKAPLPKPSSLPDLDQLNSVNRTHKALNPEVERRRLERIAQANLKLESGSGNE